MVRSEENKKLQKNNSEEYERGRKEVLDEIFKIIDAGADAYTKVNNIKKLILADIA